jgi:DNA-binding SARP family transcriptional activator
MEFRLLGEVQLHAGGESLDLGTPRQQTVLAAFAVDAGRPVRIETLVDRVWNDDPPVEARNVLYSHLSRIRQLLKRASAVTGKPARLARRHAGYVLEIDPDLVDLHRFTHLVEQGGDPRCTDADRAEVLTEALGLWRGPPVCRVPG